LETHGRKPIVPEKTLVIKCTVPIFGETHGCSARLSRTKPLDAKSTASICWKHVAAGPTVPDKTNRRRQNIRRPKFAPVTQSWRQSRILGSSVMSVLERRTRPCRPRAPFVFLTNAYAENFLGVTMQIGGGRFAAFRLLGYLVNTCSFVAHGPRFFRTCLIFVYPYPD
jgi:hypothetical protein